MFVPDEGRYAEIAREMFTSGNYLTPHLNGIKYFEKPILFYWLEIAAIKIGGLNLWSLRSINALLGLLGCLATYCCGRLLYDRATGLLAALVLGTSFLYFTMAHMISLDVPVTVFLTISLYCFLAGHQTPSNTQRRLYLWGSALAAGLAVLSKGLIGIVFPLMIIGTWMATTHLTQSETLLQRLKRLSLPSSLLLFLFVTVPWHWLVNQSNPEFFHFYFIEQHFLRYTTKDIGHYQPSWFFIPTLLLGFFPWTLFLPQALLQIRRQACKGPRTHADLFFFIWALLIFIFFSFSKSKLIPYILPVLPPLAMLVARYLQQALLLKHVTPGIQIACFGFFLSTILLAGIVIYFLHTTALPNPAMAAFTLSLAFLCLTAGSLFAFFYAFFDTAKTIRIVLLSTWLFLMTALTSVPAIDTRTIKPLAMQLNKLIKPQDEVITYNQYYQDLPFYLERQVSILNWRNELSFGMRYQDTRAWMIEETSFWERFHSKQRVFVLLSQSEYQSFRENPAHGPYTLLGETLTTVLISNQK